MRIDPSKLVANENSITQEEPSKNDTAAPVKSGDILEHVTQSDEYYDNLFNGGTTENSDKTSNMQSLLEQTEQLKDQKMYGMASAQGNEAEDPDLLSADEETKGGTWSKVGLVGTQGSGFEAGAGVHDGSAEAHAEGINIWAEGFQADIGGQTTGVPVGGHNLNLNANLTLSGIVDADAGYVAAASAGKDTYLKVGGEAFIGARLRAEGSAGVGDFADVHAGAEYLSGVGITGFVGAGLEDGTLKADFQIGAALLMGASIDAGFEIDIDALQAAIADPANEGIHDATLTKEWLSNIAENIESSASDAMQQASQVAQDTTEAAQQAAEEATDEIVNTAEEASQAVVEFVGNLVNW